MNSDYLFDAVMTRLKVTVGIKSDRQIAKKLGLSGSAYANIKKRGSIPYDKVIALAISQKVNIHWLFTGVGVGVGECEQGHLVPSSTLWPGLEPRVEKIIGLLAGLTARQFNQIEWALEDYQALNKLMNAFDELQQQVKGTTTR